MAYTRERYREIGARHGSGDVAEERAEAEEKWRRDLTVLSRYGHGQATFDAFVALGVDHTRARTERAAAIAAKSAAVLAASGTLTEYKAWFDQTLSVLEILAEEDEALEGQVWAARGREADGIDAQAAALVTLLEQQQTGVADDGDSADLISRGKALVAKIREVLPGRAAAKRETATDTEEIDILDGKLVVRIASLNRAGRRAFRALGNRARFADYKYHHLRATGASTDEDLAEDLAIPEPPTAGEA